MGFKVTEFESKIEVVDIVGNIFIVEKNEINNLAITNFAKDNGSNNNSSVGQHLLYILNNNIKFVLRDEIKKYK